MNMAKQDRIFKSTVIKILAYQLAYVVFVKNLVGMGLTEISLY